jgi:hypothetical protein
LEKEVKGTGRIMDFEISKAYESDSEPGAEISKDHEEVTKGQ